MWKQFENWQIEGLKALAEHDAERVEQALNTLWAGMPNLLQDVALAAVKHRRMTVNECALALGRSAEEIEILLRRSNSEDASPVFAVVQSQEGTVARLETTQIAIWEVVREYRKLGSIERLREAYPSIEPDELAAAMRYAQAHPAEIEAQIERYEQMVQRHRASYPFMKMPKTG